MFGDGARPKPSGLPTKWWWQMRQHLHIQATTQMHQPPRLTHVDYTVTGTSQGAQCKLNGSKPSAQPAHRRRQRQRQLTHRRGRCLDAWSAGDGSDDLFDLDKQTRQAGTHEVRQQAEGAVPLRAIPPGHTKALRTGSRIAAMARETAATAGVQRARGQGRIAPCPGLDVGIDA